MKDHLRDRCGTCTMKVVKGDDFDKTMEIDDSARNVMASAGYMALPFRLLPTVS